MVDRTQGASHKGASDTATAMQKYAKWAEQPPAQQLGENAPKRIEYQMVISVDETHGAINATRESQWIGFSGNVYIIYHLPKNMDVPECSHEVQFP